MSTNPDFLKNHILRVMGGFQSSISEWKKDIDSFLQEIINFANRESLLIKPHHIESVKKYLVGKAKTIVNQYCQNKGISRRFPVYLSLIESLTSLAKAKGNKFKEYAKDHNALLLRRKHLNMAPKKSQNQDVGSKATPGNFIQAFLTLIGNSRWRKPLAVITVFVLILFTIWKSLPDDIKKDIIKNIPRIFFLLKHPALPPKSSPPSTTSRTSQLTSTPVSTPHPIWRRKPIRLSGQMKKEMAQLQKYVEELLVNTKRQNEATGEERDDLHPTDAQFFKVAMKYHEVNRFANNCLSGIKRLKHGKRCNSLRSFSQARRSLETQYYIEIPGRLMIPLPKLIKSLQSEGKISFSAETLIEILDRLIQFSRYDEKEHLRIHIDIIKAEGSFLGANASVFKDHIASYTEEAFCSSEIPIKRVPSLGSDYIVEISYKLGQQGKLNRGLVCEVGYNVQIIETRTGKRIWEFTDQKEHHYRDRLFQVDIMLPGQTIEDIAKIKFDPYFFEFEDYFELLRN